MEGRWQADEKGHSRGLLPEAALANHLVGLCEFKEHLRFRYDIGYILHARMLESENYL